MSTTTDDERPVRSLVPVRMDKMPWSRFHWMVIFGLGTAWILDGLEVQLVANGGYEGTLAINGTYWFGAMIGAVGSSILLNTEYFHEDLGWRIAFFLGPVFGLVIIYLRRHIPESPRWLVTHGHEDEGARVADGIDGELRNRGVDVPHFDEKADGIWIKAREGLRPRQLAYVFFRMYPTRTLLAVTLMITQSFLYNAIFFTSSIVLQNFYDKTAASAALYFFPFALGNLLGPLLLGHFFDTIGRRRMIGGCYTIAAAVLALSAVLSDGVGDLPAGGAGPGHLVRLRDRPDRRGVRAGAVRPADRGRVGPGPLFGGYLLASGIMVVGGLVAFIFGVDAEGKSLEEIAPPLSSFDDEGNETVRLPV